MNTKKKQSMIQLKTKAYTTYRNTTTMYTAYATYIKTSSNFGNVIDIKNRIQNKVLYKSDNIFMKLTKAITFLWKMY